MVSVWLAEILAPWKTRWGAQHQAFQRTQALQNIPGSLISLPKLSPTSCIIASVRNRQTSY